MGRGDVRGPFIIDSEYDEKLILKFTAHLTGISTLFLA